MDKGIARCAIPDIVTKIKASNTGSERNHGERKRRNIHRVHVAKKAITQSHIKATAAQPISTVERRNTGNILLATYGDWVADGAQVDAGRAENLPDERLVAFDVGHDGQGSPVAVRWRGKGVGHAKAGCDTKMTVKTGAKVA